MRGERAKDAAALAGRFAINAWIAGRLFHSACIAHVGSNDGIYIGLAR